MADMADLSWWDGGVPGGPDAAGFAALGVQGVSLYITRDTTGKAATPQRIAAAHAAGEFVSLNFEDYATDYLGGYSAGVSNGQFAAQLAKTLGYPAGCGIPFSVDSDVQPAGMGVAMAYLDGCRAGLAGSNYFVGAYGSFAVCQAALAGGHVDYVWQTLAWSYSLILGQAVFYQDGRQAGGGGADLNQIRQAPGSLVWWPTGMAPAGGSASPILGGFLMALSDQQQVEVYQRVAALLDAAARNQVELSTFIQEINAPDTRTILGQLKENGDQVWQLLAASDGLAARVASLQTQVVDMQAEVTALSGALRAAGMSQAQIDAIKAAAFDGVRGGLTGATATITPAVLPSPIQGAPIV